MSRLINPHVHLKRDLVVGDYIKFIATDAKLRSGRNDSLKIVSPPNILLGRGVYVRSNDIIRKVIYRERGG